MPSINTDTVKHKDWLKDKTFDNCLLNRKQFGEFLADYVCSERDGFVLNLDSSWGTGKTEFLQRFYTELINRNHPTIYIDAWESDFSDNPLSVVASELLLQLEKLNSNIGQDFSSASRVLGKLVKGSIIGAAGYLGKKYLDDSTTTVEVAKTLLGDDEVDPKHLMKKVKEGHHQQVEAIKEVRRTLSQLAEVLKQNLNTNIPVVVLVDELDRCRPSYAVEMLEVIKHFFTTKSFVFVVATDTEQLCHSIRAIYGNDFDSTRYLKRFFDRKAVLPEPDIESYVLAKAPDFSEYQQNLNLYPKFPDDGTSLALHISYAAQSAGLGLRDLDQLIARFEACLRVANNMFLKNPTINQSISVPILLMGLIEFDKDDTRFSSRSTSKANMTTSSFNGQTPLAIRSQTYEGLTQRCLELIAIDSSEVGKTYELNDYVTEFANQLHPLNLNSSGLLIVIESIFLIENSNKVWNWDDHKKIIELSGYLE
ncbi:KAP family P-loop NTPase fold protein [Photobacterium salinisoli]|uniref:KAP family P-loop NTPase fold protein n=1 Tax=Photobacterium salinisoli TaxID=1616783 RepID=UPI000EA0A488|nr:P-loop NTPase fold protein [Photobacterium salinisoli]